MITKDTQTKLSPNEALNLLKEGNARFIKNKKNSHDLGEEVQCTRDSQYPLAVLLSCIDSRTSSELIFDLGIGDIFSARLAGNVLNEDVLGSMEYACKVAGSKLVVVLGHTKCGAVTSACQKVELGNITALLKKIQPAVDKIERQVEDINSPEAIQMVADENVHMTIENIRKKSEILADMEQKGEILIVGGMYDLSTGKVNFY